MSASLWYRGGARLISQLCGGGGGGCGYGGGGGGADGEFLRFAAQIRVCVTYW
jgi:hypothetical protein